jgi:hypothetical protein
LEELEKHYERAEVDAQRNNEGKEYQITTKNLTHLVLRETSHAGKIRIDGQELLGSPRPGLPRALRYARRVAQRSTGCRARSMMPWNEAVNQQALCEILPRSSAYRRR